MRRGDTRRQICRAGAGRGETDADFARGAGVTVGGVGRALLVGR